MQGKIEDLMNMCFYTNEIDEITSATNDTKSKLPSGWELLEIKNDQKTGFVAAVYKKNDTVSIVIKGSDFNHFKSGVKDYVGTNLAFVFGKQPVQYEPARDFYNAVKQKYGNSNKILVVGSSLGGGIAQYLGVKGDCKDKIITFNPVGTLRTSKKIFLDGKKPNCSNIYNFIVDNDPIANFIGQNGNIHVIKAPINPKDSFIHKKAQSILKWKDFHCVGSVKNYTPKEILNYSVDNIDKVFGINKKVKIDLFDFVPDKLKPFNLTVNNPVKLLNAPEPCNSFSPFRLNK